MSVLWILVGFSVAVAAGFLAAFIWAVRTGQFDDRYTPSIRMLFDDQSVSAETRRASSTTTKESVVHGTSDNQLR